MKPNEERVELTAADLQRFWSKVNKAAACWLWIPSVNDSEYGNFEVRGIQIRSHRLSYLLEHGPIPDGLQLDHLCRVPRCVNPDHLDPVTGQVNTLRSPIAPSAINSRKIECIHGHPFTVENTGYDRGKRYCLECKRRSTRITARKRRARERGEVA